MDSVKDRNDVGFEYISLPKYCPTFSRETMSVAKNSILYQTNFVFLKIIFS